MTAYLREPESASFTAVEMTRLEAELQKLQRDLIVLPIGSLSDVVVDATGKLPCGYRMQQPAVMALAGSVSPGLVTLLRDLTEDSQLSWRSYRDLLQIVFEQRWKRIEKLVLYGTRHAGTIDTVGRRASHVDLLEAYEASQRIGTVHYALLQGRRLQLWLVSQPIRDGYWAGHVLEADEGGRGSWRISKAILTPFGATAAGARTAAGRTLTAHSRKDRLAAMQELAWKSMELEWVKESTATFLETSLAGVLACALGARYKLHRPLVTRILRRCAKQQQVLTGELLLSMSLKQGALPLQISVFTDIVRRSAYYWLTNRSRGVLSG